VHAAPLHPYAIRKVAVTSAKRRVIGVDSAHDLVDLIRRFFSGACRLISILFVVIVIVIVGFFSGISARLASRSSAFRNICLRLASRILDVPFVLLARFIKPRH